MDKLRRMEIFVAVVQAGQFTRAADSLGLTKSAVSHAVNDLEAHLRVQLLERDNRRIILTPAGQIVYKESQSVLGSIRALEENMQGSRGGLVGKIRMTTSITFGAARLSHIIADFTLSNPDVEIDIAFTEEKVDIIRTRMDFAVRIGSQMDKTLESRYIKEVGVFLCASPAFLAKHNGITTLEGLETLNCLKFEGTPVWPLMKGGKKVMFTPKGSLESNSGESILELAKAGYGVALLPDFLFEPARAEGKLTRFLPEFSVAPNGVYGIYIVSAPNRRRAKHVTALIEYISERLSA